MIDVSPLYDLRVRTSRLELRLGTREELVKLGRLAEQGVHPPEEMPFLVAWTDEIGKPDFLDGFVAFHEGHLARWSPDEWELHLLVWSHGVLVGTQGIDAKRFAETRRVHTGSWIGQRHQRRGVGTEMRRAVLELAFGGLGALTAASDWLEGNVASRRVSEKLGYVEVGLDTAFPRGEPVRLHRVERHRGSWIPPVGIELGGLEPCLPLFSLSEEPAGPS